MSNKEATTKAVEGGKSKAHDAAIQLDKMLRPELYKQQVADLRNAQRITAEHTRLQTAVVEAAKALVEVENRSPCPDNGSITLPLRLRFEDAVNALLDYEKEHKS